MECIIQVFPDEFHIRTLEMYLRACSELHEDVNIRNVMSSLVDRFIKTTIPLDSASSAADSDDAQTATVTLFEIFSKQIAEIIKVCTKMMLNLNRERRRKREREREKKEKAHV